MTHTVAPRETSLKRPSGIPLSVLIAVECRKLVDTRAGAALLLSIILISAIATVVWLWVGGAEAASWASMVDSASFGWSLLLPLVGIVAATSEWSQRTGLVMFVIEPRRTRMVMAKIVAVMAFGIALYVSTFAIAAGLNAIVGFSTEAGADWSVDPAVALGLLGGTMIYAIMGVAFGLLFLSTPVAIVAYLLLPMVATFANGIPAVMHVAGWVDLTSAVLPLYIGELDAISAAKLLTAVLLWVVVPLIGGLLRIHRKEVV
ncbi:ABC transporter permease [Microbacterium amylolyticum]|uniref:ABC-type transport system involved in multi-copper enzyme maturation permease subunit n=1 Tax=Microbacterium amylolyticum TaxID=936337 RepID=A0ABS4ZH49_9MICO|nr:ABC transporter permease [Microbacterium amylolyticum]MBP2436611.1 ABC-type transport system involved in multi-copper enzyme maturation permease subunit [Microbacterium amylolyticum]